jgi:hypothetical protein
MAHYAKVENGIVTNVIVADQEFIDSGAVGDPTTWIQTSYNTFGGKHRMGGTPLRKNYAGMNNTLFYFITRTLSLEIRLYTRCTEPHLRLLDIDTQKNRTHKLESSEFLFEFYFLV